MVWVQCPFPQKSSANYENSWRTLFWQRAIFTFGENLLRDFLYLYIHHLGVYTFIRMLNLAQGLANVLYISEMEILSQLEYVIFNCGPELSSYWYALFLLILQPISCHSISQPPFGVETWNFNTMCVSLKSSAFWRCRLFFHPHDWFWGKKLHFWT